MTRTKYEAKTFVIVADHEPGWELYTMLCKVPNSVSAAWIAKDIAEIHYSDGSSELVAVKTRKLPSRR